MCTKILNEVEGPPVLDKEIGKDFLSSWKSMSVTEDDAMDFSFDTVSNGKKKFNFDKLDMDFNLDGDFDKLSSFKVDMPELDFSCSSKKTAKSKERTEENSSSGNCEGKKDLFSFSFDFNDEDFTNDAQIGSKLVGNMMSLNKELTDAEHFSLRSEKNVNSPRNIRDGFNSDDEQNGSKLFGESSPQDKQVTQGKPAILIKKNAGEDFYASDAQIATALVDNSESLTTELSEGEPVLLRSENKVKNLSDSLEGIESDGAQSESKLAAEAKLQDEQVAQGEPVTPGSEKDTGEDFNSNEAKISKKLVGIKSEELRKNKPVSLESEMDAENDDNISREGIDADFVQNGCQVVGNSRPPEKEATTGELVTIKRTKSSGFRVILSSSTEKTNKSTVEASGDPKFVVSSMQAIRDLKNDSVQGTKTSKRPHDLSTTIEKTSKSTADASKNPKFVVSSMQAIRNVKNGSIEGTVTGKQTPDISVSAEKISKSSAEASGNPKLMVSSMQAIRNLKNDSIDGIKTGERTPDISADGIKTGKRTADLSSLKTLRFDASIALCVLQGLSLKIFVKNCSLGLHLSQHRTMGRNKEVPNPSVLRQSNSFRNLEQNSKLLSNMTSNIPLPVGGTDKQKPLTTVSLKRKKTEESNAELMSLKSLKRLSESPKESRYFKESSGRVIEGKVCNHENQDTKNVLNDDSTSGLDSREINMGELEITVGMENDRNVESAEAYTKELENICNMLKKKHEEAKELLVRAIILISNCVMAACAVQFSGIISSLRCCSFYQILRSYSAQESIKHGA
ncbi:hypothetical protein KPL71_005804 [Citrus sinensis]|uniref:Uncharacterized protein n=2 Tax=Citrus sinensis TaxID=2711 RepID=A0ACB8NHA8_CITSI|nr:hypothetical protein KPL71_005804 [Citrus sinensis]